MAASIALKISKKKKTNKNVEFREQMSIEVDGEFVFGQKVKVDFW